MGRAMGESDKTPRRSAKKARCAIYTRKSSEEGLEQAFNSLDAQREACAAFLADLQDSDKYGYVRAFGVAMIYLGLGDRDQALTWLEKGCNDRDVWALNLKVDPIYADLRTDARFVALLRRVGLQPSSPSWQVPPRRRRRDPRPANDATAAADPATGDITTAS